MGNIYDRLLKGKADSQTVCRLQAHFGKDYTHTHAHKNTHVHAKVLMVISRTKITGNF